MTKGTRIYVVIERRKRRIRERDIPAMPAMATASAPGLLFSFEGRTFTEMFVIRYPHGRDNLYYVEFVGDLNWNLSNRSGSGETLPLTLHNGQTEHVRDTLVVDENDMREALTHFLRTGMMSESCLWVCQQAAHRGADTT